MAALGGVAKGGGTSARPRAVEKHQCDAWKPARVETWPGGLSTVPAAVHCTAAARDRAEELEEGEKFLNEISEISRDQTVKQR